MHPVETVQKALSVILSRTIQSVRSAEIFFFYGKSFNVIINARCRCQKDFHLVACAVLNRIETRV